MTYCRLFISYCNEAVKSRLQILIGTVSIETNSATRRNSMVPVGLF